MNDAASDRLARRLARERSARQQAEAIAETRLRESYDQQRELDLLATIATLSNESADVRTTYETVLPLLVAHGAWMTGHVLLPTADDPQAIGSSGIWFHANPAAGDIVRAATTGRRFGSGEGLPGLAFRHGATWEPDFATSTTFLRRDELPVGSGCAFPIMAGSDVVAVFEFISLAPRAPDPRFLRICDLIGTSLGRVAERSRSAAAQTAARNALETAVAERTRDLVEARRAVTATAGARQAFHAALSHDLGTPLHALSAALAEARITQGADRDRLLTVAAAASEALKERAARLLRNADSDQQEVAPRIVSLRRALEPTVAAYQRILGDTTRRVIVTADPQSDSEVFMDESALVHATEAMLAAALLADEHSDIEVMLSVTSTHTAVSAAVSGHDLTVPELARQAAEAADGEVCVHPDADSGRTTMTLTLPCVLPELARTGVSRRVLLADDTSVMRQLCSAMVSSLGYQVDVVSDGGEAMAAMAARDYGLVLMDLSMPHIDGVTATRLIRSGRSGPVAAATPVVALTAHTSTGHLLRSRLAGMDDVLTKPFTKQQLADVLERFVPAS